GECREGEAPAEPIFVVMVAMQKGNKPNYRDTQLVLNLLLVVLFTLITASLVTPLVIRLIDHASILEGLRGYSGPKVFRRLLMVFFLIGVWIWRRRLVLPRIEEIGLIRHNAWRRHVLTGLLVGLIGLALVQGAALGLGYRVPEREREIGVGLVVQAVVNGACTGLAVGILEEIVFRGFLLHSLMRRTGRIFAIGLTSVVFATLHFFRSGSIQVDRNSFFVGPLSAWDLLCGWWDNMQLFPDFAGLFLVSVVLCWSVLRSGDIYVAIGLHAGWVFVIQTGKDLFDTVREVSSLPFGGAQLYDGLVTIALLIAMIPFLHWCVRLGWIRRNAQSQTTRRPIPSPPGRGLG
ncbi:MAG: CPBP family intramembrane glutamic endopeptidase, partial [bacterium]